MTNFSRSPHHLPGPHCGFLSLLRLSEMFTIGVVLVWRCISTRSWMAPFHLKRRRLSVTSLGLTKCSFNCKPLELFRKLPRIQDFLVQILQEGTSQVYHWEETNARASNLTHFLSLQQLQGELLPPARLTAWSWKWWWMDADVPDFKKGWVFRFQPLIFQGVNLSCFPFWQVIFPKNLLIGIAANHPNECNISSIMSVRLA